jgi:predicted Zn-ribbon and HTH transcriptional regulator
MVKWMRELFSSLAEIKAQTKTDKKSSIITDVVGFNEPIQCILEIEVPAACRNCGTQWKQTLINVYAVKNSIYVYDYCSKCIDMTNAVDRMIKYHKKVGTKSDG